MERWETGARGLWELCTRRGKQTGLGLANSGPRAKYGPSPVSNTSMVKNENLEHFYKLERSQKSHIFDTWKFFEIQISVSLNSYWQGVTPIC